MAYKNKSDHKAYDKKYREINSEKIKAYQAEYRKRWREKNPDYWRKWRASQYGNYVKKSFCEKCGFVGEFCQLDVNHIDGNHKNNDTVNLETVCANCHRLISLREKHTKGR